MANDKRYRYETTRAVDVEFRGMNLTIPAGHRVVGLMGGMGMSYYSDEPHKVIDHKHFYYHDAVHYGIPIPADALKALDSEADRLLKNLKQSR